MIEALADWWLAGGASWGVGIHIFLCWQAVRLRKGWLTWVSLIVQIALMVAAVSCATTIHFE